MKSQQNLFKAFIILFSLLAIPAYAQEDDRGYIVQVGQEAPVFTVTTTDG